MGEADGARQGLAWLGHPVTLVALITLLVNDHVLKQAYPGLVTGKLSDVAGLVVAPPLMAALVLLVARRAPAGPTAVVAVVTVGAGFALVKAWPAAARVASGAWSILNGPSIIRADPTDLLALPALGAAWWAWTRARHRPAPSNLTRAVRLGVVLPVALAGVVATTAPYAYIQVATGIGPGVGADAVILVGREWVTATSPDGITWSERDPDAQAPTGTDGPACAWALDSTCANYEPAAVAAARVRHPIACTADGRCLRVVAEHLRVEESTDGQRSWATAWEVDDARRERWARQIANEARDDRTYRGDPLADLTCSSIYVVPSSGVVVVACGAMGFVTRDQTGTWTAIGFSGEGVPTEFDERSAVDTLNFLMIVLCGWFILLLGGVAHAVRHRAGTYAGTRTTLALLVSLACLPVMVLRPDLHDFVIGDPTFASWACLPFLAVVMLAWLLVYRHGHGHFPWRVGVPAVVAPTAAWFVHASVLDARIGWSPGWTAIWVTLGAGLVVSVVLGLTAPRPAARPGDYAVNSYVT